MAIKDYYKTFASLGQFQASIFLLLTIKRFKIGKIQSIRSGTNETEGIYKVFFKVVI